jgi:hypothetical protein
MIRLNDKDNSRINEKDINFYRVEENESVCITINIIICGDYEHLRYETKEARDKDIELLDKILDVKSIEDKANAYPHEIDVLNYTASGIKKESKLVSEGEYDLVKKEEYLTWDEVCNKKGEFFSAEISNVLVTVVYNSREIAIFNDNAIASFVYDKDLFNALKLKKVE